MKIPDDIKYKLKEGECIACCRSLVVCMSNDIPKRKDVEVDLEFERSGNEVLIRHIIKDDPNNPLFIEYYADKEFIDNITKNLLVTVVFVDNNFRQLLVYDIKLVKEDAQILRREIGLGT
ncbi:MAG: hypothetical protein QXV69_06440 [Sulfolobaceae archaeon]